MAEGYPARVISLVTGGAGFIGSNLVNHLVTKGDEVRVIDNLRTGYRENVPQGVTLFEADITDDATLRTAMHGVDVVFHQAAARSVIASVEQPLETDYVNTHGTLAVLKAAVDCGVRRVVCASSSSVYGGLAKLPTSEDAPALPRSPYAVSKLAAEHYCRVFTELYGLETISLRYFNVYGPRQRPDSAYAAVIPLFIRALARNEAVVVHGDGQQRRDFTYVDDVVEANIRAAKAPPVTAGKAFNIAQGSTTSLLELIHILAELMNVVPKVEHGEPRRGDVRASHADTSAAREALGFVAAFSMETGLRHTLEWFATR